MVKKFLQNRWLSQIDDLCKILIVVLCIVKNCTLYAQGYFNNTYYYLAFDSLNRTESYGGVVELPLNNYLAGGNSWNYLNGSTKLLFDKVDETGELVFQKAYGDTGDFFIVSDMKSLTDGSIGVLIAKSSYLQDSTWFNFVKANSDGDTIWSKIYSTGYLKSNPRKFCVTNDGGFALVGWTGAAQNGHGKTCIIKLDSLGTLEWSKEYGDTSKFNVGTSIIQLNRGGYLTTSWFSEGQSNTYIRNSKLSRLNESGDEVWTMEYGLPGLLDNIEEILEVDSNSFAMIGSRCLGPGYLDNANGWFVLVDSMGNVLINKNYGTQFLEGLDRFVKTANGFFAEGVQQLTTSSFSRGLLIKLDLFGDSIWSKSYIYDSTRSNYDDNTWGLTQTSDFGVILFGQSRPGLSGTQDAWLIKVDSNGCPDTTCAMLVSVPNNSHMNESPCLIFPNPSYGYSNLQISNDFFQCEATVSVYDMKGNLICRNFLVSENRQKIIPLRKVEPGIYLVSIISGSKEQIMKWIVMK